MTTPTIEDLRATWSGRATDRIVGERDPFTAAVLDELADGRPATADALVRATGRPLEEVRQRIATAARAGYEVEDGAVVGAALTLNQTPHRFRVRGRDLHTWCGFDALFLPLLIDETAAVRSTCPVTGQPITLVVHADGHASDIRPSSTQIAIVGSAVASCCEVTGPGSDVCTQMPFLASPEAGEQWLRGRHGVAVVDLDTGMQVARSYAHGWNG